MSFIDITKISKQFFIKGSLNFSGILNNENSAYANCDHFDIKYRTLACLANITQFYVNSGYTKRCLLTMSYFTSKPFPLNHVFNFVAISSVLS